MQVYIRPKQILMGSSLAFNLKEGPVRCAKVCDKSWVILKNLCVIKTDNKAKTMFISSHKKKPKAYRLNLL